MERFPNPASRGQSTAEFAIVAPVLILLFFGMTLAAFYAFRAAAADWGIFITGVAEGSFHGSAANQARSSVVWTDIGSAISSYGNSAEYRQAWSEIDKTGNYPWLFGIHLREHHRAAAFFRLWRFYPGPPTGEIE